MPSGGNAERKHDENQEHNNRLPVRWLALYGPANSIRGVSHERGVAASAVRTLS